MIISFIYRVTEDEVCTSFDWLYEPIPEERDRAVYTFGWYIEQHLFCIFKT